MWQPGRYDQDISSEVHSPPLFNHPQDPTEKRVQHSLTEYGKGARFLRFYHAGMAEDMEEGWWGPKMWAASVRIAFPYSVS